MAKIKTVFNCRTCGAVHARWNGRCPDCGTWDSLEEERIDPAAKQDPQRGFGGGGLGGGGQVGLAIASMGEDGIDGGAAVALPMSQVAPESNLSRRISSGIHELDRVFGSSMASESVDGKGARSGLVPGSAVLIGGEPGIGKSTLLLQAAVRWARGGTRVLYVTSEESAEQIKLRAERLGAERLGAQRLGEPGVGGAAGVAATDELFVLADTNLARIVEQIRKVRPGIVIIDSIQMIYKADVSAAPGSVTQLRRCASELVYLAKLSGIAVLLVGHVTKQGNLAGPRLLEHVVDAVVYFEGDRYHAHRVVRAVKNRFGTTLEIGLFEMTGRGLVEVPEGAGVAAVAAGAGREARPGSVVCPIVTGTRCVLIELQALTATGFLGAAKKKSSGLDPNRLAMLVAVLEQHAQLRLADRDIFASSVGGLRVVEPASDLALLLAIAGAHHRRALDPLTAAVGEVGLGGEIRPVTQLEQRVREASRLGFKRLIVPRTARRAEGVKGIELVPAKTIDEAIEQLG
jgi:DNA repair protein RadA/Sms